MTDMMFRGSARGELGGVALYCEIHSRRSQSEANGGCCSEWPPPGCSPPTFSKIDIDARGRGRWEQRLGQIARRLVVDDVVDADVLDKATLGRTALADPITVLPLELGDLAWRPIRRQSTGGGAARNDHHVTRSRHCDLEQATDPKPSAMACRQTPGMPGAGARLVSRLLQGLRHVREPFAPAEPGGDEIAGLNRGSSEAATSPIAPPSSTSPTWKLGRQPLTSSSWRRGSPRSRPRHLFARPGRSRIDRTIGHAATHIGIHRHPEVSDLNFARRRAGHRHRNELEIVGTGHADKSGISRRYCHATFAALSLLSVESYHGADSTPEPS